MRKSVRFLIMVLYVAPFACYARAVVSRAAQVTNTPTAGYTYNYMYPYMNNQMRQTLNPGNAGVQSANPINAVVKTTALSEKTTDSAGRSVVARSGRISRSATTSAGTASSINSALSRATGGNVTNSLRNTTTRRVTSRSGQARAVRNTVSRSGTTTDTVSTGVYVSSSRCLSDYTDCMDSYCERSDTEYNRCFCSSRLAQIESTYQPQIDSLVKDIISAQNTTTWTDAEMAEYWQDKVGQYVGGSSWANLNDALDIDWPDPDAKMQGQNAYLMGHEYCVNNLVNCAYAAANMRDVYRSEITRDCTTYENSLKKLKTALETALEAYQN